MKCHRCQEDMVLYEVRQRYCLTCQRELRAAASKGQPIPLRRFRAADLTGWIRPGPSAA